MLIHRTCATNVIALFETGADAVTTCRDVANKFLAAKHYYGFGALIGMLATGAFAFNVAAGIPKPLTFSSFAGEFKQPKHVFSLAIAGMNIATQGWRWLQMKQENKKWESGKLVPSQHLTIKKWNEVFK